MKMFLVLFSLAALVGNVAFAGPGCNMFPANKLRFPVRGDGKHMTRHQFTNILNATKSVYQPQFQALGYKFYVEDKWFDPQVNACASPSLPCIQLEKLLLAGQRPPAANKDFRFIEIYGGLARHPEMTQESLMLVICHEIGHHLAGYPRIDQNRGPMATEGQSDYFATSKCARSIYEAMSPKTHQNWAWANKNRIPKEVIQPCVARFPKPGDDAIYCARSSLAGLSLARTLMSVRGGTELAKLSFVQKDPEVVNQTFEDHPGAQCRLDTYVAGALCQVHHHIPFSPIDPAAGACVTAKDPASRPNCWYKVPVLARRR